MESSQKHIALNNDPVVVTHDSDRKFSTTLFAEIDKECINFTLEYNNMATLVDEWDDGWFEWRMNLNEIEKIHETLGNLITKVKTKLKC
jgi:hypothetical protein